MFLFCCCSFGCGTLPCTKVVVYGFALLGLDWSGSSRIGIPASMCRAAQLLPLPKPVDRAGASAGTPMETEKRETVQEKQTPVQRSLPYVLAGLLLQESRPGRSADESLAVSGMIHRFLGGRPGPGCLLWSLERRRLLLISHQKLHLLLQRKSILVTRRGRAPWKRHGRIPARAL